MTFIRSVIFFIVQMTWTPLYATLVLFTFPLKPHTRYYYIKGLAHSLMWLLRVICNIRMEVRGAENIPRQPCIILSKHQSAWETFALQTVFPDQVYVLKRELLWLPFFGWGLALTSPIAIDRSKGHAALKTLARKGRERLAQGFWIGLYPEGTRVPPGEAPPLRSGFAALHVLIFRSLSAAPAPDRFSSRISEYFRERMTPGAPALNAAFTAPRTSEGWVLFSPLPVGISMSMPG